MITPEQAGTLSGDVPGTPEPVERWLPMVYQELRAIARRERRHLSGGETLITTALVNDAYLRLSGDQAFVSRGQFLGIAAVAIRRILIDRVRAQLAEKRGGGASHVSLDDETENAENADFAVEDDANVLAVHEAMDGLAALNPRLAQVVECRFFAGYDDAQTAEALGLSERTVQRDWALARAWLRKELADR